MADQEKILAALRDLDVLDDDQWTTDGSPKVEFVSKIVGSPVTRQEIFDASPGFNRSKTLNEEVEKEEEKVPDEGWSYESFKAHVYSLKKDNLESGMKEVEEAQKSVQEKIDALLLTKEQMSRSISIFRQRISEVFPNATNGEAIRAFIESQTKARADRAATRNEILKSISPKDLDPRAPIDVAMSRKNSRGSARPIRG